MIDFMKRIAAMPRFSRGRVGLRITGNSRLFFRFLHWRYRTGVTRRLGPFFSQNHDLVQMDITYDCNLKCRSCGRQCDQAPSTERISLQQIDRFLEQSRERNRQYIGFRVMGGEPTLHPDLIEILERLLEYRKVSPGTAVRLETNGFGEETKKVLSRLPEGVLVLDTGKKSRKQGQFRRINLAPVDLDECRPYSFLNACRNKHYCGFGFTPYGFYPCGTAGAIDRVFGFDVGRKELPDHCDEMIEATEKLCAYCGFFWEKLGLKVSTPETVSSSWHDALERYREKRPPLSLYR